MVVDSSAVIAVLLGEEGAERFIDAFASPERKLMTAVNRLETGIVIEARKGAAGAKLLSRFLAMSEIEIVAHDSGQAEIALDAWRRFGKGRHPAGLNLGDCAAYALALSSGEALLFKGDGFTKTDVAEWEG